MKATLDADQFITNNETKEVKKKTIKLTHTWQKHQNTWVIIGGMADNK